MSSLLDPPPAWGDIAKTPLPAELEAHPTAGKRLESMLEELRMLSDHATLPWLASMPGEGGEASRALFDAGGKRLRPVMALVCAGAVSGEPGLALQVAAAVELLHSGSLLHDDVIDEGTLRRGEPAARIKWSNSVSVLSGDFCIFAAINALVDLGRLDVLQRAMSVANHLVEGELLQMRRASADTPPTPEEYFLVIERKTASLFSFASGAGAMVGGAEKDLSERMFEYGRDFGLGFQIVDDVLDVQGDPASLGKAVGQDAREGKATLPLLYAFEEKPELFDRYRQQQDSDDVVGWSRFMREVQATGAGRRAATEAMRYLAQARAKLPDDYPRYTELLVSIEEMALSALKKAC